MPVLPEWITPEWPAPASVRAVSTTRQGGVSEGPYASLNLGDHVGDRPAAVVENRRLLEVALKLPAPPYWLTQVHGCRVVPSGAPDRHADAAMTSEIGRVCVVMTADCLPVLLCNREGTKVAAVHAGWRGLAAGVIDRAILAFQEPGESLLAWMGPAIGPDRFEVGDEVRAVFVQHDPAAEGAFLPIRPGHWRANIYELAWQRMAVHKLGFVGGGEYCTVSDQERFFSYRRDNVTGRMASLIWIEAQ